MKRKIILPIAVFILTLALVLIPLQMLLVPHDAAANPEAALIREFTDGFSAQEVLFLGDCEIYESFSTVTLWQEYGIDAWLCGSPQQLMWHSYAMLQQAFRNGAPSVVVLGVYGLRYSYPQHEVYNRMALDGLEKPLTLVPTLKDSMVEGESMLSYYIPLLRYHDRWNQLSARDISLLFEKTEPISCQGYLVKTEIVPDENGIPDHDDAEPLIYPDFGKQALAYFDKIVTLCRQRGVPLILVKAPTDSWAYPWYDEWERQVCALAEHYDLPYYNLLTCAGEIGLDYTKDTYDGGFHLNVSGAEKTAHYFGEVLQRDYGVQNKKGDAARAARWEGVILRYEKQKLQ